MRTERGFVALVDADSFYASCERRRGRGPEVVVCNPEREVVLAVTSRLKKYGVHSGAPLKKFLHILSLVDLVEADPDYYWQCSQEVEEVCSREGRGTIRLSVDEWLVFPLCEEGRELTWATELQSRVWRDCGLPVSIGVARKGSWAKIASKCAKPRGIFVVFPSAERIFLNMWGKEIRNCDRFVEEPGPRKSFSSTHTFRQRTYVSSASVVCLKLLYFLYAKSLNSGTLVEGVGVGVRFADDLSWKRTQISFSPTTALFPAKKFVMSSISTLAPPSRPIRSVRVWVRTSFQRELSFSQTLQGGSSVYPLCCL